MGPVWKKLLKTNGDVVSAIMKSTVKQKSWVEKHSTKVPEHSGTSEAGRE
jgi:hypothetical protein